MTKEQIEQTAEREYPLLNEINLFHNEIAIRERAAFIKGATSPEVAPLPVVGCGFGGGGTGDEPVPLMRLCIIVVYCQIWKPLIRRLFYLFLCHGCFFLIVNP